MRYSLRIFGLALLFPLQVCANSWLLGFDGGLISIHSKVRANIVNADPAVAAPTGMPVGSNMATELHRMRDKGSLWGVMLGYEWDRHPALIASLELRFNWESVEEPHTFNFTAVDGVSQFTSQAEFHRGNQLELVSRLGVKTSTIWYPYLVLGGLVSRDELKYASVLVHPGVTQSDFLSKKDRDWGWLAGVGFDVPLLQDSIVPLFRASTIRAEYNYVRTQHIKMDDLYAPFNGRYSTKPFMHVFKLSFVLKHSD